MLAELFIFDKDLFPPLVSCFALPFWGTAVFQIPVVRFLLVPDFDLPAVFIAGNVPLRGADHADPAVSSRSLAYGTDNLGHSHTARYTARL